MTTITIERAVVHRALSALEYHTQQTRPIHNTELAIEDLRAALAAPATATSGRFKIGDHVFKVKGSQWSGRIVGWYSTDLTPIGWAVESFIERDSVQIYPDAALELIDEAAPATVPDRHAQELLAQDITLQNMAERHAQELCAYSVTVDKLRAEIDKLQAQLVRQQASYEAEIKVEIDAALERAAVACEVIETDKWALYKGRPPYTGAEPGRADNYVQGESGGACSCASAIRALKDADKC